MSDDFENMDFEDDDFNFEDDSFDINMDPPKDDRNPIAKARDSILKDVGSGLTDPSRIGSTVKDSLPSGYKSAVTSADSFIAKTNDLYDDAVKDVGPSVRELKRQTKRALPRMKQYMPESWYNKAEAFLQDEEELRMQAQGDADSAAISGSLASIFEQQNNTDRQEKLEDTAQGVIEKKVDDQRHKSSTEIQVGVLNRLQQLVEYNNKIDSKVSRQSLELQFRSYFTLRDLLEVTKRTSEDTVTHLGDIVKNTGLPDLLKHKPHENALQMLEDSIYGKRVDEIAGKIEPFIDKMKGKAVERVKGLTERFKTGVDQGSEMLGGLSDAHDAMAEAGMAGPGIVDIGSTMVAGNLVDRAFTRVGGWLGDWMERQESTNNEKLMYSFADTSGLAARIAGSDEEEVMIGNYKVPKMIRNLFRGLMEGEGSAVSQAVTETIANIRGKETESVSYDVMSRKTLVEIIPWYLRKQLSKLDVLTGGDGSEYAYNPSKGRITTMASGIKDARRETFDANSERAKLASLSSTVESIDPEDKLDAISRRKLAELMNESAKAGFNFDPAEFITLMESSSDPATRDMAGQMREMLGIDKDGEVKDSKATFRKLASITSQYKGVRDSYTNDRQKVAGDYARSGSNELLQEAGILVDDGSRKGSELRFNSKLVDDYRSQIIRTLFRDEVNEDAPTVGEFVGPRPQRTPGAPDKPDEDLGDDTRSAKMRSIVTARIDSLRARDAEVRGHENAHSDIGGDYAGTPNYEMRKGPDGIDYAVGGEVQIDMSEVPNDPQATIDRMHAIRAAALAPAEPSSADKMIAEEASVKIAKALEELSKDQEGDKGTLSFNGKLGKLRTGSKLSSSSRGAGTAPESTSSSYKATSTPKLDDPLMDEYFARQAAAKVKAEIAAKEELNPADGEPASTQEHLAQLIGVNTQGFMDTVEAIMAASPNDEEVRSRYFGSLRKRMGARVRKVGSFLGSSFKTGTSLAMMPFKLAKGIVGGFTDVLFGERDIYVEGEGQHPILTVSELGRGNYYDEKGKVISTLINVKKPVYGKDGNQILTAEHLTKGTYTKSPLGKKVKVWGDKGGAWIRRKITGALGGTVGRVFKAVRNVAQGASKFVRKLGNRQLRRDLYLKGEGLIPKLTLADLTAGKYFHPETGDPITSFSQIRSGVKDREGNWLLSPEKVAQLVDINGRVVKIRGLITSAFRLISKPTRMVFGGIKRAANYINNKVSDRLKTDVYVYETRGRKKTVKLVPKLYYEAMKRGEYYNRAEDGSIGMSIRSFAQIAGPIVNAKGIILITEAHIKAGLFDKNGKRLVLAGTVKYLATAAKNLVLAPVKKIFNMAKSFKNWIFGGDELDAKGGLMGKISGFFGALRRPKIETMKVTTDIVYINAKSLFKGGGGGGDTPKVGALLKDRANQMRAAGAATGADLRAKGKALYDNRDAHLANGAAQLKGSKLGKLLGRGKDKLAAPFAKVAKEFNFDFDAPNAQKRLMRLKRRILITGTKKQKRLMRAMEKHMDKHKEEGFKGRAKRLLGMGEPDPNLVGPARPNMKQRAQQAVGGFMGKVKAKAKPGDADGDGLRDGGYREEAKDKSKSLKERALNLFRRKQTKNGETQVELLGKLLKSMKKTEKNTKDGIGDGGMDLSSMLLAAAGGGVGGGVLAKMKGMFGGKKAATEGAKQAGKQVAKEGAKQAGKGVVRSVLGNVARQVVFGAGRMLAASAATAAVAALGIGVGAAALIAGAVATVGAGGWYTWKYISRRGDVDVIERFRFISYGLNPDDTDELVAIRYLEDKLEGEVTAKGFKDPIEEIIDDYAEDFDIKDDDAEGYRRFSEWLVGRFLPIFTSWTLGAAKLGVDLDDVYDDLKRPDYVMLAEATFYKSTDKRDPYAILASPFEGRTLYGRSDVRAALNALRDGEGDDNYDAKKEGPKKGDKKPRIDDVKKDTKDKPKADVPVPPGGKRPPALVAPKRVLPGKYETLVNTDKPSGMPTLDEFKSAGALAKAKAKLDAEKALLGAATATAAASASLLVSDDVKRSGNVAAGNPGVPTVESGDDININMSGSKSATMDAINKRRMANPKLRRAMKQKLQSQRWNYIQKAILAGTSTTLPPALTQGGLTGTERAYLDRQAALLRAKIANGQERTPETVIPSAEISTLESQKQRGIERQRAIERRNLTTPKATVNPEEYTTKLRERSLAASVNMDNTLFYMYTLLDERLPVILDEEEEERNKRRAARRDKEVYDRNKRDADDKKRQPPAPLTANVKVDPVSFEKDRQRRM